MDDLYRLIEKYLLDRKATNPVKVVVDANHNFLLIDLHTNMEVVKQPCTSQRRLAHPEWRPMQGFGMYEFCPWASPFVAIGLRNLPLGHFVRRQYLEKNFIWEKETSTIGYKADRYPLPRQA